MWEGGDGCGDQELLAVMDDAEKKEVGVERKKQRRRKKKGRSIEEGIGDGPKARK